MTYNANIEASQQEAMPEFFEIDAAGTRDRYTSFNRELTFLGNVWTPAAIKRTGLTTDTEFGAVRMNLNAPLSGNFARYIANQPVEPVQLTVYRAIKSDLTDYVVIFRGRVVSLGIKDMEVRAICESRSSLFGKKIPNVIYQSYCNNDVFDTKCSLIEYAWRVLGDVTSINGNNYTISGFSSYVDGYFAGGTVQFGQDYRLVTNHVGDVVTLQIPFDTRVYIGAELVGLPGCDGSPLMCRDRFSNLVNFVGMPYIPSHNPIIWGFHNTSVGPQYVQ